MLWKDRFDTDDEENLKEGTIIPLNTFAGLPIPIIKAGKIIAYGEVLVIDE